jgi:divalent metal cation (Fe/Co/Zn/Cd) transporter
MDKRRCIGLGGLGPAATVHYYKKLAEGHVKQHPPLDLLMVHAETSRAFEPLLPRAKKKVGNELGSAAMHADAKQTDFSVYLSVILLAGLLLNAALGWWWADPTAALIMAPIIAKEGIDGLRARTCCLHAC